MDPEQPPSENMAPNEGPQLGVDPVKLALSFISGSSTADVEREQLLSLFDTFDHAGEDIRRALLDSDAANIAEQYLGTSTRRSLFDCYLLLFVRMSGIYKSQGTFENFCVKLGITHQTARNCIRRAEVALLILRDNPRLAPPEKVATVAALKSLPDEHVARCWQEVLESAAGISPSDNHARTTIKAYRQAHGLAEDEAEDGNEVMTIDDLDTLFPDHVSRLFREKYEDTSLARHVLDAFGKYGSSSGHRTTVLKAVEGLRKNNRDDYDDLVIALMGILYRSMAEAYKGEGLPLEQ